MGPRRRERGRQLSSPFTAEAVEALGGPPWLRARRTAAFERFASTPLPTTDEEHWRYSRIAELDLDSWRPRAASGEEPGGVPEALGATLDDLGERAALLVVRDGVVVHTEISPAAAAAGVEIGRLVDLDASGESLGAVTPTRTDALDLLHDAFATDPALVRVPPGVVVPGPVLVLHWTATPELASCPHLVVQAGEDAEVVIHDHQGSADVAALVVPVVELDARRAARLTYVGAQVLGPRVWQLGRQSSRAAGDATLTTTTVALGADYARLALDSTLIGKGGSGEMRAVYFGEGNQLHDFRTLQDHVAPNTTSNLLFKGAVQGHARSVYTGLIHIGKQAAGVNAFQTNRNIKLSEGAWAESVPNLEIENNDVHCSHASAVGPVDEEQRFYLESRGIPPRVAERLIVLGFFDEVLDDLAVPGARSALRSEIAAKLDRRDREAARA